MPGAWRKDGAEMVLMDAELVYKTRAWNSASANNYDAQAAVQGQVDSLEFWKPRRVRRRFAYDDTAVKLVLSGAKISTGLGGVLGEGQPDDLCFTIDGPLHVEVQYLVEQRGDALHLLITFKARPRHPNLIGAGQVAMSQDEHFYTFANDFCRTM
jgi:hypothetical protein